MPECRGITVHVTDVNGQSLPEWGVQHINRNHRGSRVSAHIQSTTDAIFEISLQPRIPWYDKDHPYSVDLDSWQGTRRQERKAKDQGVPPYAFLAALYLDGRMQPERRAIIYTDPSGHDYNRPDGKVLLKHRIVQLNDGRIIEHGWAFKEKAIELVFDKLNLKGHQDDSDEATIVNALLSSRLSTPDKDQDKKKVGQIFVEIRKVKVDPPYVGPKSRTRFKEGQDNDVDPSELKGDITHRTGFVRKGTLPRHEVENKLVVRYRPWDLEEGVYASFLFFYRSREQLAKFGFPGFPPLPNGARKDRRLLDNTLSNLTPLSISSQAESSSNQAKGKPESFEDKVKKRKSSHISADAQMPAQSDGTLPPQLRSFSGLGQTSKPIAALKASRTKTTSKITVPPPLPPSLQAFKKIQREKLASQTSKPINDEEADTDVSEPGTESDLESLIGDEKIPTDPNPEEESHTHESLREQLGGIEIRKRRHDEVDQKLDSRSTLDQLKSSKDAPTRDLNLVVEALTASREMKLVKKEDDEEEGRGKRVKSGTA